MLFCHIFKNLWLFQTFFIHYLKLNEMYKIIYWFVFSVSFWFNFRHWLSGMNSKFFRKVNLIVILYKKVSSMIFVNNDYKLTKCFLKKMVFLIELLSNLLHKGKIMQSIQRKTIITKERNFANMNVKNLWFIGIWKAIFKRFSLDEYTMYLELWNFDRYDLSSFFYSLFKHLLWRKSKMLI